MLLLDKVAVVYGTGGIGAAVAREFASEGATVFITGDKWWPVELVVKEIQAAGGYAEPSLLDAFDEDAVEEHLQSVIRYVGHVDISFNAVGIPYEEALGVPLTRTDTLECSLPIRPETTSSFLTARLAARHMIANGSGVIMNVTELRPGRISPLNGGYWAAQAATEAMTHDLSCELAPHGVRVLGLGLYGSAETETRAAVFDSTARPNDMTWDEFQGYLIRTTRPKRVMTLDEVAEVAAFVASNRASGLTGTTVGLTMGTIDG